MPVFEDLSRELRQEIFRLAFKDAIKTDIKFNSNIQLYIRTYGGEIRLETRPPIDLHHLLGPAPSYDDNWHPNSFAPHLCTAFEVLCAAFPTVIDDARFVFGKAIDLFEKEVLKMKELERDGYYYRHYFDQNAINQYANRAEMKHELFDEGVGIENNSASLASFKVTTKMVKRFNFVVRTHYPRRRDYN